MKVANRILPWPVPLKLVNLYLVEGLGPTTDLQAFVGDPERWVNPQPSHTASLKTLPIFPQMVSCGSKSKGILH